MTRYYLDSCIWLNFFKKEDAPKGIPFWKTAQLFLKKVIFSKDEIIYSGFVLKEIRYKLDNEKLFENKHRFIKQEPKFRFIKALDEDYKLARKIESESAFEISFFDCQHIAISKRLGCVLVTRDRKLLEVAKKYIVAYRPEELFS